MRRSFIASLLLLPLCIQAQVESEYPRQTGNFSLGTRSIVSLFNHGDLKSMGYGIGGHFRIQPAERINTEWFYDYISSSFNKQAYRYDNHIGWSVMFYLINTHAFQRPVTPYIMAGHCFDWTRITISGKPEMTRKKFSTAVQAGVGANFNITTRLDMTLAAQYMMHIGKELHLEKDAEGSYFIEEVKNPGWEGHLLISLSLNYKFLKLWKRKASALS